LSHEAQIWVDDVLTGVDPVSKAIMSKLAGVADDHDCGWMTVSLLAQRTGASERTVQGRMRALERQGLLKNTGRTYRYGTRSVPLYELAVDHVAVAAILKDRQQRREAIMQGRGQGPKSMGATVCTHADEPPASDDASCTRMGAAVCTPKEDIREQVEANASTERASESAGADIEAEFQAFMAAYPASGLKRTSWARARTAFAEACALVDAPGVLIQCATTYAADPIMQRGDHGAVNAVEFLAGERWRSFVPGSAAAAQASAAAPRFADEAVRAAVVTAKGEAFAVTCLDPAAWDGEARAITPRTNWAEGQLRTELRQVLSDLDVKIVGRAG
jgi:DNA-binding transcriptional ArsR family regulator